LSNYNREQDIDKPNVDICLSSILPFLSLLFLGICRRVLRQESAYYLRADRLLYDRIIVAVLTAIEATLDVMMLPIIDVTKESWFPAR